MRMKKLKFNIAIEKKFEDSHYKERTIGQFKTWYEKLYEFSNFQSLSTVSFKVISDFIAYLSNETDYSVSSVRQAISSLEFLYNSVYGKNYHFSDIKIRRPERAIPKSISKESVKAIINNIENPKQKLIISIIYSCGLDISELINIRIEDIDIQSNKIKIRKDDEIYRETVIGNYLGDAIVNYLTAYKPTSYLFEGFTPNKPYSASSIRKIFDRAKSEVPNCKDFTIKNLKYSYVKHLVDEGFQLTDILNHIGLSSYEIYSRLDNEERLIEYSPLDTLFNRKNRDKTSFSVTDEQAENILFTDNQTKQLIQKNPGLIKSFIEHELTDSDITAVGYRKQELEKFRKLLQDEDFFKQELEKVENKSKEALWQNFFEKNTWIFGYGLNYIFATTLEEKKLEQVVSGYTFNSSGKRVDGLLKTKGLISSLCFVEIKRHDTSLIDSKEYRPDCWNVSRELSGAVSQIQKTVQRSINELPTQNRLSDKKGNPTGETVFLYKPKSYLIIGTLAEFVTEFGINESKFSSFELFRQNIDSPEIITFDELYERAKYLINNE